MENGLLILKQEATQTLTSMGFRVCKPYIRLLGRGVVWASPKLGRPKKPDLSRPIGTNGASG